MLSIFPHPLSESLGKRAWYTKWSQQLCISSLVSNYCIKRMLAGCFTSFAYNLDNDPGHGFSVQIKYEEVISEGAMQATVFFIRQEFCHNLKWSEMLLFSQVPVACKSCPCGYIFISRKLLHAKRAERSPPIAGNTDEGPEGGDNSSFPLFLGSRA